MNNYQTVVKRGLDDEEESLMYTEENEKSKIGRIEINEKASSNYNS